MPCRKLTRLRTVIWVVFLVVSALVAFQKNVFKKKVVKVQSKNLGYPNTIRFSSARINASKSRSFEVTDLLKTKETAKHLHSSEINTKQDYVIQFLQRNGGQIYIPKVYQQDFLALKRYVDYLKQSEKSAPLQTKAVIIFTNYRSGSSFFGEFLNQHPDVFYVFEPLIAASSLWTCSKNKDRKKKIIQNLSQCIIPNWKELQKAKTEKPLMGPHIALSCFQRKFCFAPKTKELLSDTVCPKSHLVTEEFNPWLHCGEINLNLTTNLCRRKKMVAIKLIRACNINILQELVTKLNIDLKIIHLVRDPRGIGSSRMLIHRSLSLTKTSQFTCDRLRRNAEVGLFTKPAWLRDRYKMIRYEDVALNPEGKARELFEFLGLKFVDTVKDWIINNTDLKSSIAKPINLSSHDSKDFSKKSLFSVDPWDLKRDSKRVVQKWQHHLYFSQIKSIQQFCGEFMNMAGYLPINNVREYANKSKFFFLDKIPGKKFKNKDIKQALVNFFTSKDEIFFKNGIYKLLARWQEVINNNGNYII